MVKFFWTATFVVSLAIAQIEAVCFIHSFGPHALFIGPEYSHISRTREGGSKQTGNLVGGHIRYDRISPHSIYLGADAYYDTGKAKGKTASGKQIRSTIDEYEIQARLGYNLYIDRINQLLIIPYATYSYFYGRNKFYGPSPNQYKLHDHLHLGGAGLWVSFCLFDCCRLGVDFNAKYIVDGKNKVTDDPEYDNIKLEIESQWQYELAIPIEFKVPVCDCCLECRFVPFYRFRHLGGKPNYPFDYKETKYRLYGAQLLFYIGF
jgi:hypothetical protein